MSPGGYVFQKARRGAELERLRAIEALFDPPTRRLLESTGVGAGGRVLEVGAGAGSVARWLADRGAAVVALDLDCRFLHADPHPGVTPLEGDVLSAELEPSSFDLVHARYVVLHIARSKDALRAMVRALRPGGALVVEEPDFSAARAAAGGEEARRAFARVHRAVGTMFRSRGMDEALGFLLPELALELGLENLSVDYEAPLVRGGSGVAEMMRLSALQLRDAYVATGEASKADVDAYCGFARNPGAWAIYYATVRVSATKPA